MEIHIYLVDRKLPYALSSVDTHTLFAPQPSKPPLFQHLLLFPTNSSSPWATDRAFCSNAPRLWNSILPEHLRAPQSTVELPVNT